MGQRQHGIDTYDPATKTCKPFARSTLQNTPMDPKTDPVSALAHYGALARDGISCASCHHMVLGKTDTEKYRNEPQNACIPGAAAGGQSALHGLCRDLHGQLLRRTAERALRAVPGAEEEADEARDRHRSGAQPDHHQGRDVRHLPHRACADPAPRQDDRARLRAVDLSGMGVQRLPHRRLARRQAGIRLRPAGAVLPELPHAEQGRGGQSVPQQDRGDPGILAISRRPSTRCRRPTSTCRSAPASASTRWSGSTSICSRWRGSSPTSSASARPIRC